MAYQTRDRSARAPLLDRQTQAALERRGQELLGLALLGAGALPALMLWSYSPDDPNWLGSSDAAATNWLGTFGASVAHPLMLVVGRAAWGLPAALGAWGLRLVAHRAEARARAVFAPVWVGALAAALAALAPPEGWAQASGQGGLLGDTALGIVLTVLPLGPSVAALLLAGAALALGLFALGVTPQEIRSGRERLQVLLVLGYAWGLRQGARGLLAAMDGAQAARARIADAREAHAERAAARAEAAREAAEAQAALDEEMARAAALAEEAALPEARADRRPARTMPGVLAEPPLAGVGGRAAIVRPLSPRAMPPAVGEVLARLPHAPRPEPRTRPEAEAEPASCLASDGLDEVEDHRAGEDAAGRVEASPMPGALAAFAPAGAPPAAPAPAPAPAPLAAPVRAAPASFLTTLLRRARGEVDAAGPGEAAPATPHLSDAERIQARINDAIRARAQGSKAPRASSALRVEPPLAARVLPQRRPLLAEAPQAPDAAVPTMEAAAEIAPVLPPPMRAPVDVVPVALPLPRSGPTVAARVGAGPRPVAETDQGLADAEADAGADAEAGPEDALPIIEAAFGARAAPAAVRIAAPPARPAPERAPQGTAPSAPRARAQARPVPAYEAPPLDLLADPGRVQRHHLDDAALERNARDLEQVLDDFGVKGEITQVRPGPVVTMYELEPAPGVKASRVIGLADDIARNMSALSARVSTVPGRNVIGIELPNEKRERVVLREIVEARDFGDAAMRLPLALGKDIGGEPVVANLAKMPHLLIAGTTGSGKSVAINTMILSLLYKLTPEECRLIMIDPKMLELSVYDGIPHLLSPVVTDPRKAVVALKWVVGEMEERYRKMSKMGVRNLDGYNGRVREALAQGETFSRTVQTGFDDETGDPVFETDEIIPEVIPYIVVIVDEMADLMMTAGKEIEACIQRLAQMARASGIHLIMATQRPSVDVITGIIKANFPTRISFQVTSKIDSRTILGEQGAEQLLGQGDMLYMAGGGRITRVHGPFCSDEEVEEVVTWLKGFGPPSYVGAVLEEQPDDGGDSEVAVTGQETEDALYDMAVQIVAKDRKCSTSYIQRKLAIGYNKAARLVEQMEQQGVVTPANHVGKREILVPEVH